MGEKTLVEMESAIQLTQQLDRAGSSPSFVCWYYYDNADEWRLVVAGPAFDSLLPNQEPLAYQKIIEAIAKIPQTSLSGSDIKVISTASPLVQAARMLAHTDATGFARAHFTNCTINGIFIKEVVIFRSS